MQPRARGGFTLIELVVVLVLVGVLVAIAAPRFLSIVSEAEDASVAAQAAALRSNNRINVAACKAGSEECVDVTESGTEACVDGLETFLPDLDKDTWQVENIDSNVSPEQWGAKVAAQESEVGSEVGLFVITRFLGPPDEDHKDDSWFEKWNARQPCMLWRD